MKKNISIKMAFLLLLSLLFYYYLFKPYCNCKNVKNVKIGMNINSLFEIMGDPDNVDSTQKTGFDETFYYYDPIFSSSEGITIIVNDSSKEVQLIVPCGD